jgi:hypothetical protein
MHKGEFTLNINCHVYVGLQDDKICCFPFINHPLMEEILITRDSHTNLDFP